MARDNFDRLVQHSAKPASSTTLGAWQAGTFHFASPSHERAWQAQAYRQSVHPDRWQAEPPVDAKTQALLEDMPHLGSGRFFRGPDGQLRRITKAQREDADVAKLRQEAFNDLARSGVTWDELGKYPDDKPHPGEDAAIAIMDTKRTIAKQTRSSDLALNDIGVPNTGGSDLTRVAGPMGLDVGKNAEAWGAKSAQTTPPPVLVANSDRAAPSGLPKDLLPPEPFAPKMPAPGVKQRREFLEGLVGVPANDNKRPAANDNHAGSAAVTSPTTASPAPSNAQKPPVFAQKTRPNENQALSSEEEADWAVTNRLFNWKRDGKPAPAPAEYALNAVSDEGRYTYLEEMKDEWSRLLEQNPEKVFLSMAGEVDKLSSAAMLDFWGAYRREATPAERGEIVDAVMKMVFAPAEHWSQPGEKPNEKVGEAKPFLGVVQSTDLSGAELAGVFSEAATLIEEGKTEKFGGRPGSKETRRIIAHVVKKLAKAIEACGGQVRSRFYGPDEKFLRSADGGTKGGSFADKMLEFDYNNKRIGFFGNHAGTYADRLTLKPNEANQISKLVANIAQGMRDGTLEIDAAGIGYFSKRKPGQSFKDYLRTVNDFVKKMVDCKRPFLIKIRIEKPKGAKELPLNDNDWQ